MKLESVLDVGGLPGTGASSVTCSPQLADCDTPEADALGLGLQEASTLDKNPRKNSKSAPSRRASAPATASGAGSLLPEAASTLGPSQTKLPAGHASESDPRQTGGASFSQSKLARRATLRRDSSISKMMASSLQRVGKRGQYLVASPSLFSPPTQMPHCFSVSHQKHFKGEDTFLIDKFNLAEERDLTVHVFAVFDGHMNSSTAQYCTDHLMAELVPRFPRSGMPPEHDCVAFETYLHRIRSAVCETFEALDEQSIEAHFHSGCTASVLIVTGWVATVANVGDSDVMIQTLKSHKVINPAHRLSGNQQELTRVLDTGAHVAPLSATLTGPAASHDDGIAPLRIWPVGLALSRAIGDEQCGPAVAATPHIVQLQIPYLGARFVVASDGVWDAIPESAVAMIAQQLPLASTAKEIGQRVLRSQGLSDDVTSIVIDVMACPADSFNMIYAAGTAGASSMGSKVWSCLSSSTNSCTSPSFPEDCQLFAKVDMLSYKAHMQAQCPGHGNTWDSAKDTDRAAANKPMYGMLEFRDAVSSGSSRLSSIS